MRQRYYISATVGLLCLLVAGAGFEVHAGSKTGSSRVYNMLALDPHQGPELTALPNGGDEIPAEAGKWGIAQPGADPERGTVPSPGTGSVGEGRSMAGLIRPFDDDARAKEFHESTLPGLERLMNQRQGHAGGLEPSSLDLDPGRLRLKTDADVRLYFLGENTSKANTLGFTTDGSGWANSAMAKTIFPNASSPSTPAGGSTVLKRSVSEPLLPGDFVSLGRISRGTQLDFFLIADGAHGGSVTFSSQRQENPDGLRHMVRVASAAKDSPYLLLAFEDQFGGGDRDFDDLLFAVDVGCVNVAALIATPEPATWVTMGTFLGVGLWMARRRRGGRGTETVRPA